MGVPGFFKWLKKKYKNKNFVFTKDSIKDINIIEDINSIDYFLIDTNCLIHPVCFKILNQNLDLNDYNELKNKMFFAITDYLLKLIEFINPKKGVYIAIDGVAPFAKIKQQRQRRYKSVADKKLWDNIKKKHSKPIYSLLWNNSTITPGTEFMEELHNHILNWYKNLNINIIYSSYLTPGEGEHKLLQFIRNNQYINNIYSYVIYGLDADLIFLALSTNNNKIYLLRESNEINNDNSEDILNYVSIDVMKQLIINTVKTIYMNKYNILLDFENNKIINDFIFICYFLGNDFIPHIPSLDIHQNGIEYLIINYIDTIYEIYFENTIIQYLLISSKKINNNFLEKFIKKLSLQEENNLKNNLNNNNYYINNKLNFNDNYEKELFKIENLQFKINDPIKLGYDSHEKWRIRYYKHYWNISEDEIEEFSLKLVKHYFYGLKWITLYYFDKCPSWDWYFPFDHPPFLSDIYKYLNNIKFNKINFKIGKPIKPFLQLLIVLPLQLNYLLPLNFRNIIKNNINITYLYPNEFEQDFINKKKHWMGIPILPPLNIKLIKKIYLQYKNELTDIENLRNINCFIFEKKVDI